MAGHCGWLSKEVTLVLETKKGVLSIPSPDQIKQVLKQAPVDAFEVIPLVRPLSFNHYQKWLEKGQQGEMDYMQKKQAVRQDPAQHFPPMRSMIVFTQSYYPPEQEPDQHFRSLKIAHYARSKDYHLWFRDQLNELIDQLQAAWPEESFLAFTDAVPLLERDHAVQAGLGWVGKNTCVIHPKRGSLFFIGEILCSFDCDQSFPPMHDFCGNCTACIDVCPTDALSTPRVLDANKCLAHWNIESRSVPPVEIREKMEAWFFGCDLCQTVCPWNLKLFKTEPDFAQQSSESEDLLADLTHILQTSNKALMRQVKDSPLSRAGGRGLKRNALIVIANLKLKPLLSVVESYLNHEELGELAQWTLNQLKA